MNFLFSLSCIGGFVSALAFMISWRLEMTNDMMAFGILMLAMMIIIHDQSV